MAEKLLLRVNEAADLASISRTKAYELLNAGEWPSVRVGASLRVPLAGLREWVQHRTRQGVPATKRLRRVAQPERRTGRSAAPGGTDARQTSAPTGDTLMLPEILCDRILDSATLAGCLAPLRRDYAAVVLLTADLPNAGRRAALRGRQEAYVATLAACLRTAGDDAAALLYQRLPWRRP